jgi:hypothetical protein
VQRAALAEAHLEAPTAEHLDLHIALGMKAEPLAQLSDLDREHAHACSTDETSNCV